MTDTVRGTSNAPPAQQRAAAVATQTRVQAAQRDAQTNLSPAPTQSTGTLPCGLPITVQPCDLKNLQVKERKTARYERARTGGESEADERVLPADFEIRTGGGRDANPYDNNTVIEVTGGIAADSAKTSIELVIGEDYQFCARSQHPHLIVRPEGAPAQVMRGVKRHTMFVYRRPRVTDGADARNFLDVWPARWGFQAYFVSAEVCGARRGGPAVRSQHTTIRVYPNEQWELEINAPSLLSLSGRRTTDRRTGEVVRSSEVQVNLPRSNMTDTHTRTTNASGVRQEQSRAYTDNRGAGFALDRQASGPGALGDQSYRNIDGSPAGELRTRFTAELKRNGVAVASLQNIVAAINAFKDLEGAVRSAFEALSALSRVGWTLDFGAEFFTGTFKATWGFKEWTDRRVFFSYTLAVHIVLFKLRVSLAFGIDMTVRGYGFVANIEGKVEGMLSVGAQLERKKPQDPEWGLARYKGDVPATLTARGMAIEERVLSLRGSVETGLEAEGKVVVDQQGPAVLLDKLEFKGVLLKGRAIVISYFDVDVEYRAVHKRELVTNKRIP